MHVWNVLHAARWPKKSPSGYHRTTVSGCISSQIRHVSTIGKKLVKQQYLLHKSAQHGELRPSGWDSFVSLGHKQLISTAFASWLRYCSDVAQRKPTKLFTMFTWAGRLYINFRRLLRRNGILPGAKFALLPPSLALSYSQRYCTAVEQWPRSKLCGVEHRAPPRGLYSAGRPSCWALAHILVCFFVLFRLYHVPTFSPFYFYFAKLF